MIALVAAAHAGGVSLDRVDLLSEHGATWLVHEAPRFADAPDVVAGRWIEQVTPVIAVGSARIALSLGAQSLALETPTWPFAASGGVITRLGLPIGLQGGAAVRTGKWRFGASLVALSAASWVRPEWTTWTLLPGIGVGVGRDHTPRAVWMEEDGT